MRKKHTQKFDNLQLDLVLPGLRLPAEASEIASELYDRYGCFEEAKESPELRRALDKIVDMEEKLMAVLPEEQKRLVLEYSDLCSTHAVINYEVMFARGLWLGVLLASTEQKAAEICARLGGNDLPRAAAQ